MTPRSARPPSAGACPPAATASCCAAPAPGAAVRSPASAGITRRGPFWNSPDKGASGKPARDVEDRGAAPYQIAKRCPAGTTPANDRSATVKYMLIIYGNEELWNSIGPDEQQRMFAAFDEFNQTHYASGELLGAYGVADAAATKLVRLR